MIPMEIEIATMKEDLTMFTGNTEKRKITTMHSKGSKQREEIEMPNIEEGTTINTRKASINTRQMKDIIIQNAERMTGQRNMTVGNIQSIKIDKLMIYSF